MKPVLFIILTIVSLAFSPADKKPKFIDKANMDFSILPGDNFYMYANGRWLKNNPVPASNTRWGSFLMLRDESSKRLKSLLTEAAANASPNPATQKIGNFYSSGMDSLALEKLGSKPIQVDLNRIGKLSNIRGILSEISLQRSQGMSNPLFGFSITPDRKNVSRYIPHFSQGGLTLPDRDYYLKDDSRSLTIRSAYVDHLLKTFELAGEPREAAKLHADAVMIIETALAKAQLTRTELRDPYKTYNKFSLGDFSKTTPSINWKTVMTDLGLSSVDSVIVNNPSFFKTADILLTAIPLKDWKSYLKWNLLNGIAGPAVTNIDIAGDDSAYVFVSVTVNPTTGVLPFIIRDSIEVSYNGNKKLVQLEAYGQNAHFLRGRQIATNTVWNNDLPYVILDGLEVLAGAKLTINKGCKVFVHADAPFIVRGSLEILGGAADNERVVFTGDRLDEPYINFPASWPGIYFLNTSKDNIINYALIKNAYQGIVVQAPNLNSNPKLSISQTVIDNAFDIGLLGLNTKITGQNLLISNCGKNMVLANGGDYQFTHCTVASFSKFFIRHKEPILLITNYLGSSPPNALAANFTNCIFWGDTASLVKNEIIVEAKGGISNVVFKHVLWNEKQTPANVNSVVKPISQYPQFDSINTVKNFYDFRLKNTSPAIDAGINTSVNLDLISKPRPVGLPDLGCYEKQ